MRFFHLSDLHIGKHLYYYSLKEEQIQVLDEIVGQAKKLRPDAILIAGDIYDKSVPSAEAVTVFDDFLTKLSEIIPAIPILIISGNHDSAERLRYAAGILKKHQIYVAGHAPRSVDEVIERVTFTDEYGEVDVYMLPFLKPSYVREVFEDDAPDSYSEAVARLIGREKIDFENRRNVLMSHQFYTGVHAPEVCDSETISVGGIDNVDISAVENFDYVALGHLHGRQQVGKAHIRYCGTPLKYSVSEADHKKCLTVVTLKEKGAEPEITELPLPVIRDVKRKRGELSEILSKVNKEEKDDYVSIILTDEIEPYQPKEQLQSVYSHILEVRIDNTRTRNKLLDFEEEEMAKDPLEAFCDFYREIHGQEIEEEELAFMTKIMEGIKED